MKTFISVVLGVVITTWVPVLWADPGISGQAQSSATLTWNGIALEAVARA